MKKAIIIILIVSSLVLIYFLTSNMDRARRNSLTAAIYQYAAPWDKNLYDKFYASAKIIDHIGVVKGGIVPHHLLAGDIDATFFNYIVWQQPSIIVLLSPNHFSNGRSKVIASARDWQTVYGVLSSANKIITQLADSGALTIDEVAIKEEHGLYSLMPFIKKSLPNTTVIPIMLKDKTDKKTLDNLVEQIYKLAPSDAVIVASIDFSHYKTKKEAVISDAVSREAIKNFDFKALNWLEIDSTSSLYVLLKLLEKAEAKQIAYDIQSDSTNYLHNPNPKETVSYYSPYFVSDKINSGF